MFMQRFLLASAIIAAAYGGICNDKKTDCANWARDGECSGDNAVRTRIAAARSARAL